MTHQNAAFEWLFHALFIIDANDSSLLEPAWTIVSVTPLKQVRGYCSTGFQIGWGGAGVELVDQSCIGPSLAHPAQ